MFVIPGFGLHKASAGNDVCKQLAPQISVTQLGENSIFNVSLVFDTRTDADPQGSLNNAGYILRMGNQSFTAYVQNGIATFDIGRLNPGDYKASIYSLTSRGQQGDARCTGPNQASFTIQDVGQPTPVPACKTENQACVEGIVGRNDCNNGTPECAKYTCQGVNAESGVGYCAYDPNFTPPISDLEARCNTSLVIDALPQCTKLDFLELKYVDRCGANSKGFVCKDPQEVLCMNGERSEENVVCTELAPIAQPCASDGFVEIDQSGKEIPVTIDRVRRVLIPSGIPFRCKGITSGLGISISTDSAGLIKSLFSILLSISGGIALLLIIVSGYHFIVSQGNPEKIQGAKETLTSAIVGLLFIIFSMVILEVIGFDILRIPGLGR